MSSRNTGAHHRRRARQHAQIHRPQTARWCCAISYVPTTNGGNASPLIPNTATTNLNERVYALTDAFGSTTAITAIDGTVLERYVYGANAGRRH